MVELGRYELQYYMLQLAYILFKMGEEEERLEKMTAYP